MKISLSTNQFFDDKGAPLSAGRITVFLHDSDTPCTVYTLSGDIYSEAQNPILTSEDGRIPTLFFDAAVVDVKVEKHVGENAYELLDTYQDGFEMPDATNDTVVEGIEGLKNTNTAVGIVAVYGYDNNVKAPMRHYIWDSTCRANADDGIVVLSNTTETGRWILLWDDEKLPCTVYGIAPGYEANIGAFLTYPDIVSRWNIRTPTIPRFIQGTYTSDTTFSTTKTLYFDDGAKFTKANFVCRSVIIPYNSTYVADFNFNIGYQPVAESRWFRSVKKFWQCGAKELHQSDANFFEDINIGNAGTICAILIDRKISGKPVLMAGGANLEFNHCNFTDYCLSTTWYTVFKNCDFCDRWFNDGLWDFGTDVTHRQLVRSTENRISLDHFADANVFVLQQAANGIAAIDLQNRNVSTVTTQMPFTLVRNAVINEAHFNHNINLENCVINHLYLEHNYLNITTRNCQLVVEQAQCGNWNDNRSYLNFNCNVNTTYVQINWLDTGVELNGNSIWRLDDDLIYQKQLVMWRCTVNNGTIASSNPVFLECNIANTPIYVFPCAIIEGVRQTWCISMEFRGNRFNGGSAIRIGGHNGHGDHLTECYEVRVDGIAITDNVFNTNVNGITMPFWAGPDLAYRFTRGMTSYQNGDPSDRTVEYFSTRYEYRGNDGNCPRQYSGPTESDLPGAQVIASHWAQTGAIEGGLSFEKGQIPYRVFVLPALINENFEPMPDVRHESNVYIVDRRCVCTPYRMKAIFSANQSGGGCADFPISGYLPICAYDKSMPNDMFDCLLGSWGESAQFFGINPLPSGE